MEYFRNHIDYDSDIVPEREKSPVKNVNYYLNSDDVDVVTWETKVLWIDPYSIHENIDTTSPMHKFKGADWSTLVRLNHYGLWVYVGLNAQDELPLDYSLRYQYSFSLKHNVNSLTVHGDEEGDKLEHLYTGTHENSITRNYYHEIEKYSDIGSSNSVYSVQQLCYNRDEIVDSEGYLTVQCQLKALPKPVTYSFRHDCKADTGMVGIDNQGSTCYLNALLQMLFHVNAFRDAVFQTPFEGEDLSDSTMLALQSTFYQLQTSKETVSTSRLTKAFGWNRREVFEQQDVQEMLRVLLDKLEEGMKGKVGVDGAIKHIFAGTVKSFIRCSHVTFESSRLEDFYDIQLDIKGCKNIYDSLRKYCAMEILSEKNENQYDAGEEFGKQDAEKCVIFTELPPVLTMHLKRFEFDMAFSKIHDEYQFPTRLDLGEFVDREEGGGRLSHTYILHSVLVHSGDVYGGHYYAHIRPTKAGTAATEGAGGEGFWSRVSQECLEGQGDAEMNTLSKAGSWFQFDDESVNAVDRRHAVEGNYGSRCDVHSAYMLVYLREVDAERVMAAVEPPEALVEKLQESYGQGQGYGGYGEYRDGGMLGLGGYFGEARETERRSDVLMHPRGAGAGAGTGTGTGERRHYGLHSDMFMDNI